MPQLSRHCPARFTTLVRAAAAALASAMANAAPSPAPGFALEIDASAQYSSYFYRTPQVQQGLQVSGVPDWDTLGRTGSAEVTLLPTQPGGGRIEGDQAVTWGRFAQPNGANATVRGYSLLAGYYLGSPTDAHTHLRVHNTLRVENNGARFARIDLMQLSHGWLLTNLEGGNAIAYAEESTVLQLTCDPNCEQFDGHRYQTRVESWGGDARVWAFRGAMLSDVNGSWAGHTTRHERAVQGLDLDDPLPALELGLVYLSEAIFLGPGGSIDVELDYELRVGTATDPTRGGFGLTVAEADFSATAQLQWRAFDASTGALAPDVRFQLVGDDRTDPRPLPEPPGLWLALAALALALGRRFGAARRPPGLTRRRSSSASSP